MVDSSIVNVAVPSIARDLKVTDLSSIQWVVSGYLLALGVALRGDRVPRQALRRASGPTPSAWCCSCSPRLPAPSRGTSDWLIAFRAVQGFVGAPLVPLAISILLGKNGMGAARFPSPPR
ncbi:MAG: hypothetical protein WDM88_05905 [Galbitalea sp.]